MWLKFEQRTEPSPLMSYLSPAIAVGLMLVSGMALFYVLGRYPFAGFKIFFLNPV